jgi:uncharacterized protein DUF6232
MTTYFADDSVLVSSTAIRVDGRSYRLDELDAVWLERGAWRPERALAVLLMRALAVVAGLALLADIVAVVAQPHHPRAGGLPAWAVWAYLFGSPFLLGALFYLAERIHARGTRTLRLCAQSRGRAFALYSSTDATRFGQVHRAVRRALESRAGA